MMYKLITKITAVFDSISRKIKILYWKIKYGKRIEIGKKLQFRKGFNILIEENGFLKIGDNCFFNNDCSINCLDKIIIGDNNLFGENVKIYDHNHTFCKDILEKNKFMTNPIIIGNNNWIGTNVVILSKTKIDNNNVIGAGVVLNHNIDSNKIVTQENRNIKTKDIKGE